MSATSQTPRVAPPPRASAGSARAIAAVIALATALGLALRLIQLARPGYLFGVTEYDDAVDFGSAVRLVHGLLPYRDFVLVQPPGISLLLAPVALLANATGTSTAFAVARILTACAGAASITLAGLLVRRRGVLATALACGLLAVFPDAVWAAHTVLLEPWLVLYCLLGLLAVFHGDELTDRRRRLAWGGAALGIAGTIKIWAVLPAAVVLVVLVAGRRRRAWPAYLGGVAAGFLVPVLPFLIAAPHGFLRDVITAQLNRTDAARVPLSTRLFSLVGLSDIHHPSHTAIIALAAALAALVLLALTVATVRTRAHPPALEWCALGCGAVVLAAFLWPADFYSHYAAFFAPFLALALALPIGRAVEPARPRALALAALAVAVAAVAWGAQRELQRIGRLKAGNPAAEADREIPAGACVLTDLPPLTLVADRFTAAARGCSAMVDPIGTAYALSNGRNGVSGAGRTPAVQATWLSAFAHAGYVWIACAPAGDPRCNPTTNRRIPWTPVVLAYFHTHFTSVPGSPRVAHVFVRRDGSNLSGQMPQAALQAQGSPVTHLHMS